MTTMILQTAGQAIGGAVAGPVGAMLGQTLGSMAGSAIDGALFGTHEYRTVEGPRLSEMQGLASSEGAPIPRVYGRARIGGQVIWATRFEEQVDVTVERTGRQGGKGFFRNSGGGGGSSVTTREVQYSYYANLAIGLCEGPIAFVRRVWADGREVDLTQITMRVHRGGASQQPDALIVAKEGAAHAPAYRGLAYVVFERLPLADFGNRVPQFSFEVVRPGEGIATMIRAVCLIPAATEFGYDPTPVMQVIGPGETRPDNRQQFQARSDVRASLDALQRLCPNLESVSLVVSWFGDDLRVGHCTIAPRVDIADKQTKGRVWSVAGLERSTARRASTHDGLPAYGGTPADASVVALIQHLKARGLKVTLYPFIMMDIPHGNALPDPRTGASGQPAYPWRGRITCDPAPDAPGSVDGTGTAAAQVASFFGSGNPGASEWSLRRQILHYAGLAVEAGGVDAFVIGSEMVSLTRIRSGPGHYPAVDAFMTLAEDVRAILGQVTRITYAADWTEYGAHVRDGGDELRFPLDPLWAHPAIDAIGIDYYPPISDWRDGGAHLDAAQARSLYDIDYLCERLGSGEGFDWYYADDAGRAAQERLPITDGAHGKPWVFRSKDLVSWWSEPHVERAGGVEIGATPYTPMAKPIWLTEIGLPAVDKGPNGPNVFPDMKSSEGAYPPFSRRTRDDLAQAAGIEAIIRRFDPAHPKHDPAHNPQSPLYGGPMVEPDSLAVWAWDARPFPAFPEFESVWADGANYETGHWVTGRLEGLDLATLIRKVLDDYRIDMPLDIAADGFVEGFVIDRPMSVRAALEPLLRIFGVDLAATGGVLRWRGRGGRIVASIAADMLVDDEEAPLMRHVRAQETELPREIVLGFTDSHGEMRRAASASRRLAGASRREVRLDLAAIMSRGQAGRLADILLQDAWAARDGAQFALGPKAIAHEVGDVVEIPGLNGPRLHRISRIVDGAERRIETRAVEPALFETPGARIAPQRRQPPSSPGQPYVVVLDLPLSQGDPVALQYLAAYADPWPGALALWRSVDGEGFAQSGFVSAAAQIGFTEAIFAPGPLWCWDRGNTLEVTLRAGAIASVGESAVLGGANSFALVGPDGLCEIIAAAEAELIGENRYRLSHLLRGLAGSEAVAGRNLAPGATLVRLDETVVPLASGLSELGREWQYRIAPVGRDHADDAALAFEAQASRLALKPLSPVHPRLRRVAGGIEIRWIRRGRVEADAWEPVEIPLGEDGEHYAVEIMDGATPKRRIPVTAPLCLYAQADEIADFGAPRTSLDLRIMQISASVGDGFPFTGTLPIAPG
ncbi:MAG: glycoside hydrolase/phage tail family protein [Salinarimonas sp.]|nr:glycoside hydrolase/phage tail family protein [Salinarimonas sp.]